MNPTVAHLNLRLDPSQYISQIRQIPDYDYIHLLRESKFMVDISLLNDRVYYLNDILSPKDYVQKNRIKLLHAHHAQLGILLLPFKHQTKLPLVTSIRGRDGTLADQTSDYLRLMKMLFNRGELFFPVCQYLAERISDWGCPSEKIRVLYGGIDLNKWKYRAPKKRKSVRILSVGRLVEKKGHHILMQAFAKVRHKFPRATLTIIGRGPLKEYILALANQLKLEDSFRLVNYLHPDKLYKKMYKADLFCAASLEAANGDLEGIPNTLKQAMATGLPVISTLHAGIPELITHQQEGLLVKENNVNELAEALDFMLSHRKQWQSFSLAARKKVEQNFEINQQLYQQAKFYDEILRW